ncbi:MULTISPECIES: allantoate deiminase [Sporomusa]|jgi:allantoate deiminase|uniref:Allantoate amidohydrolase n=2 Tax=Sporomusa TaxID=2375 RepID=A0ABP2CD13_9FIRM|nr:MULTISPECIES: allantoate deiminase [Sporomusa]OLS55266.1 allantoate amidohydrolase [Sporomusa sphaeroides DSM 2875]CVK20335.1 Allantoate amidohydrolase [Sporomusa sphaeroides DSM 2875]SCM83370.1 allantoate amidohydrolase [uncultured Sporomusa sp.]HML33029.1 allantoate deiminase [Sporomusa sphaeroides]
MSTFDFGQETEKLLKWLGEFGKDPEGGVSRFLYKPEWTEAQRNLEKYMRQAGFAVHYDDVGNLFGRLEGSTYPEETILTGSHVDTVKNGGLYDGQFGIIAGIVALEYLKREYGQPLRNIEVVSIAEEEGSRFPYVYWGVKNILGIAKREDVENMVDFDGIPFTEAMRKAGFAFRPTERAVRKDLKAFLEVHVEQGGVLEIEKKSVGIVGHIVGQRRFTIEITGQANHAGTTPMGYRKDALHAASSIICAIMDITKGYGDPLVATVGKVEIEPNIVNVVPGKALFTLDARHTHKDVLVRFTEEVTAAMQEIASQAGVGIHIDMWMDVDPVPMDTGIVEIMKQQCEKDGLSYKMMHSGAGHDSQIMAPVIPTGMLFVPSHKGLSHSPLEYTDPRDLAQGVKALVGVLYELAYK